MDDGVGTGMGVAIGPGGVAAMTCGAGGAFTAGPISFAAIVIWLGRANAGFVSGQSHTTLEMCE